MPAKRKANASATPEAEATALWVPPTEEEFQNMKSYKSCKVPPGDTYRVGSYVWLAHDQFSRPLKKIKREKTQDGKHIGKLDEEWLKANEEDNEKWENGFWLARITQIRAKDTSNVWVKMDWLCRTIEELKEQGVRSGLPKSHPGGREVFLLRESHSDIQPSSSYLIDFYALLSSVSQVPDHRQRVLFGYTGMANVISFDERNPLQTHVHWNAIFYRSEARVPSAAELATLPIKATKNRTFTKRVRQSLDASDSAEVSHLFPIREPTCYCRAPYRPRADREEPMAMCANPGCYKWFHLGCLDWKDWFRRDVTPSLLEAVQTSGVELISLLPKFGELDPSLDGADVDKVIFSSLSGAETGSVASKNGSTSVVTNKKDAPAPAPAAPDEETRELYAKWDLELPELLVRAAQTPVLRGTWGHGIVGSGRFILRARQILVLNRRVKMKASGKIPPTKTTNKQVKNGGDADGVDAGAGEEGSLEEGTEDAAETAETVEKLVKEWESIWPLNPDSSDLVPRGVIWLCPDCKKPL